MGLTIFVILIVLFILLGIFLLVRTLTFARPFEPVNPVEEIVVDEQKVAEHLAAVVHHETVSHEDPANIKIEPFDELHKSLKKLYPGVYKACSLELIGGHALFFTWEGSDPELDPVLFAAHQDVVPADPASLDKWEHPPFSGDIADGYVWGRGTLDIKSQMVTTLEAAERLIKQGYKPVRTVYFAFGHDEEVGGTRGANKIVETLQARGIRLAGVIDEGGFIVTDMIPGVKVPVAMIGIGEKGYLSLELTVEAAPGHSSLPPKKTAIGMLSKALANLEENQMPARPIMIRPMFKGVGIAAPFFMQLAFSNLWLFNGIIRRTLEALPNTNAAIRTTTAITMINSGIKDNILPNQAKAVVNFRVLPGDTIASVCSHVRKVINNDLVKFEAKPLSAWEPSHLSSTDSPEYITLTKSIRQIFGNLPVAPYLVYGATDSRYYSAICDNVYRFTPCIITSDDLSRVHAVNERISLENLGDMVKFFTLLIQSWSDGT